MVKCNERQLNRTFAALADPTRRGILEHLTQGDRCVTDLARPYAMSLPAVSKHLRVLENAGIVHSEKSGRESRFAFDPAPIDDLRKYLDRVSEQWDQALARLQSFVEG